ncbi:hypothetical protein BASA83_001139 [Batrachochytrium salamandrivorans]|nr:hypothetical protein BASA83_001139 [Batrachochytrium salamandrivorans]
MDSGHVPLLDIEMMKALTQESVEQTAQLLRQFERHSCRPWHCKRLGPAEPHELGLFPSRRHKESSSARGADASHGHDQRTQSKAVGSKDTVDAEHETAWSWIKRNLSAKALVSMFLLSLLLVEAALIIVIIARVEYTQIDWSTYMQQVSAFMAGELDYKNLHGDTGPLVYPAGFLYVYSLLYVLTGGGKYILLAQIIFGGIYITTLFVVILLYRRSQIFPIWAIPLLMLSRRNHSIYMLRLFNDPIAMLFMFSSILALTKRQYERASIWFSLALSIKMNVLLFAPGMAWVFFFNAGLVRSAMNAGLVYHPSYPGSSVLIFSAEILPDMCV